MLPPPRRIPRVPLLGAAAPKPVPLTCWDCNGTGTVLTLNRKCPALPCDRCNKTGTVPAETKRWVEWGQIIKDRRTAMRFLLVDWARLNGYDFLQLSRAERGILDPRQFHGPCAGPPPPEFLLDTASETTGMETKT